MSYRKLARSVSFIRQRKESGEANFPPVREPPRVLKKDSKCKKFQSVPNLKEMGGEGYV